MRCTLLGPVTGTLVSKLPGPRSCAAGVSGDRCQQLLSGLARLWCEIECEQGHCASVSSSGSGRHRFHELNLYNPNRVLYRSTERTNAAPLAHEMLGLLAEQHGGGVH